MIIKGIIDEDFLQYQKPSLFIITPICKCFKCEKEANCPGMCQNSRLAKEQNIEVSYDTIINRFLTNDITEAIVFGGLEPFDSWNDLYNFIRKFRKQSDDDVVIYTGYYKNEIEDYVSQLKQFPNIIVKFGRYIPNQKPHLDPILGINLASDNQYAERISDEN